MAIAIWYLFYYAVYSVYPTATHPSDSPSEQILIKFNVKIQKLSVVFCWYIAVTATFYWLAPCLMTYRSIYMASVSVENGSVQSIQYYPNLEESFYWLDNRSSVYGYAAFSIVALLVFTVASYNNATKLLTILTTIKYCNTLLQLVIIEVDNLNHVTSNAIDRELKQVIQLHQRAVR